MIIFAQINRFICAYQTNYYWSSGFPTTGQAPWNLASLFLSSQYKGLIDVCNFKSVLNNIPLCKY